MTHDAIHGPRLPDGDDAPRMLALGRRLAMPLPARTRLLNELRHDLEGLTTRLVARGMPFEEARRRASETLVPDGAALTELERLSAPRYVRATAGLRPSVVRLVERGALALATTALISAAAWALVRADLLADASPFLWPVLGLGAVLGAAVLAKAFELWVKGAHDRPRRGLGAIAALSATTLWLGCTGTLVDLVRLATVLESRPEEAVARATAWLVRDSALLATASILTLAGALGWLALSTWIAHVEHAHREAMALGDDFRSPHDKENRS